MLADLPDKYGWTLAAHAGDRSPDRMRRLLGHVVRGDAAASAPVRDFVAERLSDEFAVAVALIVAEVKRSLNLVTRT